MPGNVEAIDASVSRLAASTSAPGGGGARGAAGTKPAAAAAPMPGTPATAGARSFQHSNGESHLVAVPFSCRTIPGHLCCRSCFVRNGGPLAAGRRTRGSSRLARSPCNSSRRDGGGALVAAPERVGGAPGGATTPRAAATATAAAKTSTATALLSRRPAIYKTLPAGHRKGRGSGADGDRDAHAVGTAAPKAAAAVCDEGKATAAVVAGNPVSAAQGGKAVAVTLVVKTEETAAAPAMRPLETIAANASAGRPAMTKPQGAPTSGAVASSASTVNRDVAGIQGRERRKINIRGLICACVLGSALLLLQVGLFSDQPVPLFSFFQASNRQEGVAVPSWLPCSVHNSSYNSGSKLTSCSGSRGFYRLYKPSTRRGCFSGTLQRGSGNQRSSGLLFCLRSSSSDESEKCFQPCAVRSCTCNGSGRSVGGGFSNGKSISSTSIYRRETTRTSSSNRLKRSLYDSGSGSRGCLPLVSPCWCSGTHRKTFQTTSSSVARTVFSSENEGSTISLLNGCSPSVWSSHAYSSASTFPWKNRRAGLEGSWLLFAVADVSPDLNNARAEGAASEHTVAGRMEDCVCPSSSPGNDRSQAETAVAGRFEIEQNIEAAAQLTHQQRVEEPQLPAHDEAGKLQLPPYQDVAELELHTQHKEKGDTPQPLAEQGDEQLEGQQEGEENDHVGGQEAGADAGGPQLLRQQLEQPICEHQGCVVSDMQDVAAVVPVAEEGQKEEEEGQKEEEEGQKEEEEGQKEEDEQQLQEQQNEGVEEQRAFDGDQLGQPDDAHIAEGAYLDRQQAVSAAVSGLLPVGRHYDFMPLTKRLSTAKRLNLLEESECYEEYFSGDVTEAADAERSRSESADAVTGEGGGAGTAAGSPQDTVEDSLGTGEGPATATEEERKAEGEIEGEAQEVAASKEDAVRKAATAGAEGGAQVPPKVSSNAVQIENPSLALANAGNVAEAPEPRETLCREESEKASCGTAAGGTGGRVGAPQRELQKEATGEAEMGAAVEEPPSQGDKAARKQSTEASSSPLPAAVVDYKQEQGGKGEVAAGTAGPEEQAAVAASKQREQLLVSEWRRVAPDDIDVAFPVDTTAAAAAGHAPQRLSPVYRTCTNGELLRRAEEETASSEGEEEDGDEGEDDDEDDLTSRLPVRHRPLVTLELTSAGFEDIGAAERSPRGAHGSSFSAAVDAFSRAPLYGHAAAATPTLHVVPAPGTYSYSGVTVGSPLPSSYATLPLLLSAYNAAVPPGVLPGLTLPPNVPSSPPAPAFLSPTLPPSPVSPRPPLLPVQLPAAAAGSAESRFDDSPSNRVGFFGSNTSPRFMPQPVALAGSPAVAASAAAPPPTRARSTSAPAPHAAAGAPPPARLSSTASSAARVSTAAHVLEGDPPWNAFHSAAGAARAALPQAASQHVASRSRVVTTPAPYAAGADASRAPADAGALPAGAGSSPRASSAASAVGGAATSSPAAFVSHVPLPAKAAEPEADALWAAASATSEHYLPGAYPAAPYYPATNSPPVAHYPDAAYPGAGSNRPVPVVSNGSAVASHAGEPSWAYQNDDVSGGGGVDRLEKLRPRDIGSADGSTGVLHAHAAAGEGVAANNGISRNTSRRASGASSPPEYAAAVPELTAGTSSTGGDTTFLAATMAAAVAAQAPASAAAGGMQRLDSAAVAERHTRASKAKDALGENTGHSGDRKTAAAHTAASLQAAEESPLLPGEQTPRRLFEGPEQQKFKSVDPRLPLRSTAAAPPSGAAAVENERTGGAAAEARVQKRGRAAASEVHQRQKVTRRKTAAGTTAHGRGDKAGGGRTAAVAVASGPAAVVDDSLREPSSAAGTLSTTEHAPAAGGRAVTLALRKSGAAAAGAGAEAEGAAAAGGAGEALVRDAPTGGKNVGFSRHGGAKDEAGGDPPDFGRDVYHPDAASEPVTFSSTGATSSLAEASFKKPSDALKNLVARQDAGEWQHERDAFERHYPFKKPLLIRSTTTGRVFEIAFDSVLGAGGQGVVFAATILSEGTGVALKIFRIRPDQRRDDGREEGMLRRRVQSELNVWDFIPGGLSPREWSEFAHLVIPLDVVQPLKIHKSPPRHEVRYATQWIMMDLFAGDMARMPKIMNASASVKMEVTEQMFLSNMRLHDMGLVHSDIKLPNFFIGMDGRIFLGDHSLATPIGENVPCMSGTVRYLPPENMKCINDGRRRIMTTERKDVWALGIVLYKLWCGQQYPYEIGDLWSRDLFVRAARAHVDELDLTGCDKMATVPILGLLRIMLTPQVSKRPTLREIHKFHPLFAPQKNTLLRSRTLHSLLEEIQSGRGNFDAGKFTGSLPLKHALFAGVDLKR